MYRVLSFSPLRNYSQYSRCFIPAVTKFKLGASAFLLDVDGL